MFPSTNGTSNHFFLDTCNDRRFFDDDGLLEHIFWQEQLMLTSNELTEADAMFDDVREREMETRSHQKKKERKGTKDSGFSAPPRRRTGKKDRHSKIQTAQGLRDRRIRLSVQASRKFFDLHDMLGFDKASKTLEWLFLKSKEAIKDLTKSFRRSSPERIVDEVNDISGGGDGGKSLTSTSSEGDVISDDAEDDGCENMLGIGKGASSSVPMRRKHGKLVMQGVDLVKIRDSRVKARARARERAREKKMVKGLGISPAQACELDDTDFCAREMKCSIYDTEPDTGLLNTNQETRFLGRSTQQICDDHPLESPRLVEKFLGITSTDNIFGPNSNNLCEIIRGTEFLAETLQDPFGYNHSLQATLHGDSNQQHYHNANFIPMTASEPNPNLPVSHQGSINEQSSIFPMIY